MRIVSGQYKGRRLVTPNDYTIRPTSDKVRGSIFNMLESRGALDNSYVLDAFCGSGALGLEALSRGAKDCHFVDKDSVSVELARENAALLGCADNCDFTVKDARTLKGDGKRYNLVFLDPPYGKNYITLLLNHLAQDGFLESDAWVVCESEKGLNILHQAYNLVVEKTYGRSQIVFLRYAS